MDKYEFNLKIEQMKKLVNEEDYQTALRIAESIEWERVRNTNLLTMAATVFEKNDRLDEARGLLIMALERAPVGKRILFKLGELSVRSGDIEEAEDYYHEFHEIAPDDTGNYLLQYMLLKAKHAPYDRQLIPLERYCEADPDEKWLYELATSYEYAGRIEDSVKTCDRIALLYGDSPYSRKALRLKQRYANLTEAQRNILNPRTFTEEQVQAAQYREEAAETPVYENPLIAETEGYDQPDAAETLNRIQVAEEEYESYTAYTADMFRRSDELAAQRYEDEDAYFEAYVRAHGLGEIGEEPSEAEQEEAPSYPEEPASYQQVEEIPAYTGEFSEPEAVQPEAAEPVIEAAAEPVPEEVPESFPEAEAKIPAAPTLAAAEPVDDEGQQMAFDFGSGEPVVVTETVPEETPAEAELPVHTEEAPVPASVSAQSIEISTQQVNINVVTPPEIHTPETHVQEAPAAAETKAEVRTEPAEEKPAPMPAPAVQPVVSAAAETANTMAAAAAVVSAEAVREAAPVITPAPAAPAAPAEPAAPVPAPQAPLRPHVTAPRPVPPKPVPQAKTSFTPKPAPRPAEAPKPVPSRTFHMIIEAETAEQGLEIAVDELKSIHEENNIQHASAKTSAAKLNQRGLTDAILEKVRGKDFVIENAGDLDDDVIEDLYEMIKTDRSGTIVVLIDTPEGLDHIEDVCPDLFDICDYISDIDEEEAGKEEDAAEEDERYDDEYEDDEDDEDDEEDEEEEEPERVPQKRSNGKVNAERFNNVKTVTPGGKNDQMEIDDFAQYCAQYAASIDCSITGKSMLALYERIELMEEDGIPLTKATAEQLIEEAADRAEKPPIGKRLTGIFKGKYDKNGLLILKEEDFIF